MTASVTCTEFIYYCIIVLRFKLLISYYFKDVRELLFVVRPVRPP